MRASLIAAALGATTITASLAAQGASVQRLPITETALPPALEAYRGPSLRRLVDRAAVAPGGARARLVVYVAPCECDSGEPTATRLGLYISNGQGPASLVHSRAMLIRFEPGERRVHLDADIKVARGVFELRTSVLSFDEVTVGAARATLRHRVDSLFQYDAAGQQLLAGSLAYDAAGSSTTWVQVNPEAAAATARIARSAGLTLWRSQLQGRTLVFEPSARGWHLGPFLDRESARYAANTFTQALMSIPQRPTVQLAVVSAEATRIRGSRPLIVADDQAQLRRRLAPFISFWRDVVVRGDAELFTALFSMEHLHVNSVGSRSDFGRVFTGPEVLGEAREFFSCVRRADEALADIWVARVDPGAEYQRTFGASVARLPIQEVVTIRGARCAPGPDGEAYQISMQLGWIGTRWVILDLFSMG